MKQNRKPSLRTVAGSVAVAGALGLSTIAGAVVLSNSASAEESDWVNVTGVVWHDRNGNGGYEAASEDAIGGIKIDLIQAGGAGEDGSIRSVTTDSSGQYSVKAYANDGVSYQIRVHLNSTYDRFTEAKRDEIDNELDSDIYRSGDPAHYFGLSESFDPQPGDFPVYDAGMLLKDDGGGPTTSPTASPSKSPSKSPSESPSASPSESASGSPSSSPSESLSTSPSESGTPSPSTSEVVDPTPTTTDTDGAGGDKGDNLPTTGAKVVGLVAGGTALLAGGIALAIAARRRTQSES